MGCANGQSWYAMPFRIKPDLGKVSKNVEKPPNSESCDVFHERVARLYLANQTRELHPEPATLSFDAGSLPGKANVLARKPAADDIHVHGSNSLCIKASHIFIARNARPVLAKDGLAIRVNLAEGDGTESSGTLKPEAEPADAGEEVEDTEHVTPSCPALREAALRKT